MPRNTPHPIQLTQEDRAGILAHIQATHPTEGRIITGVVNGIEFKGTTAQLKAYREACDKLRRERRKVKA